MARKEEEEVLELDGVGLRVEEGVAGMWEWVVWEWVVCRDRAELGTSHKGGARGVANSDGLVWG